MAGLLGQFNTGNTLDAAAVADAIAKLKGRSQAQGLLRQLNQPYVPFTADVMQSMQTLGENRFSPSREIVPAASRSLVPVEPPVGNALARIPPAGGLAAPARVAAPAARYGLPALPAAGGGGGSGFPPVGSGGIPSAGGFGGNFGNFGAAEGAAANAASRFGGIASLGAEGSAAAGLARFAPGLFSAGRFAPLQAARGAAPWVIGGMVADPLIRGLLPGKSNAENVLGNTAKYAGIGAGVGSIFPGAGTLVGGLAGGTIGALSTLWSKDKAPTSQKQRNKLLSQLETTDLPDEVKKGIAAQYKTLYSLAETDEEKQAAFDAAKEQLVSAIGSNQQMSEDADTMLASQAMLQQFLQPTVRGIVSSAEQQRDLLSQLAGGLPPELRNPALASAGQRVADANRVAGAYAAQMSSIPQIAALQIEQQRQAQAPAAGTDLQALLTGG